MLEAECRRKVYCLSHTDEYADHHLVIGGALAADIRVIRVSDLTGFTGTLTDLQMDLVVLAILLSIAFSAAQGNT